MVTFTFPKFSFAIIVVVSFYLVTNAQYIGQNCYDGFGTFSSLSDYGTNIETAITSLATSASTSYFKTATVGTGSDKVNALYFCRYDVTSSVCQSCVESALKDVSSCLQSVEGLIWYQECTVHYSNRTIFGEMDFAPRIFINSLRSVNDDGEFVQLLSKTITTVISDAVSAFTTASRFFATLTGKYSDGQTLYTLAQCSEDITSSACSSCLEGSFGNFTRVNPGSFLGQMFGPNCRLSYRLSDMVMTPPYDFTIRIVSNSTIPPSSDTPPSSDSPPSSDFNPPPPSSSDDGFNPPPPSSFDNDFIPPPPRFNPNTQGFYPPPSSSRFFSPSAGTRGMSTIGAIVASFAGLMLALRMVM